jgi:hypothetical protein
MDYDLDLMAKKGHGINKMIIYVNIMLIYVNNKEKKFLIYVSSMLILY